MANVTSTQILVDGPRNTTIKFTGVLTDSDLSYAVILDPATLSDMVPNVKASTLRLMKVQFVVEAGLEVRLFWDATAPRPIATYTGQNKGDYKKFGGLKNNATGDAGYTGKVGASTQGWAATQILSFTLVMEFVKCQ